MSENLSPPAPSEPVPKPVSEAHPSPPDGAPPSPSNLRPVDVSSRIVSLDVLRGVAVLGILAMNIYAFSMPFHAYQNPTGGGGQSTLNYGVWYLTHIVFDQKFMTIFSMLFGAGLVLMMQRAAERGRSNLGRTWLKRQFWLLVIGLLHAYFLWWGDILVSYAIVGVLVYIFRNRSPKTLIITGSLLLTVLVPLSVGGSFWQQMMIDKAPALIERRDAGETLTPQETQMADSYLGMQEFLVPSEEKLAEDIATHQSGYGEIVAHRIPLVSMLIPQMFFFFTLWRVSGLMLIGMALMKLGVFSATRSDAFYRRLLVFGYGIGLPMMLASCWHLTALDWNSIAVARSGFLWNYYGSIAMSLGHVALVMLACQRGWWDALRRRLSAVGRMAFTNYLSQSLICTTIFYGYGLGLYGQVDRWVQMLVVLAVWAVQLAWSPWWLERFRFGPAEWVWRTLTYGKLPPLRRTPETANSAAA